MKFWGVEVKSGQRLKVQKELNTLLHLSHATLGLFKEGKGNEYVPLFVKVNEQNLLLGTLSVEKNPQLSVDLLFEGDFELSHNWKQGSVFFMGFRSPISEGSDSDSDDDDGVPIDMGNELVETKVKPAELPTSKDDTNPESSRKAKVNAKKSQKDTLKEYSSDLDGSDDGLVEPNRKRPSESGTKMSVSIADKKAKFTSPEVTGTKKEVRVDTPHPSKGILLSPGPSMNTGKTDKKSADKTIACASCSKKFGSEVARENHTKAKHSGK